MSVAQKIFKSSVGLKFVVGVTGLCLLGFVIAHLLGNLQIYWGAQAINEYAKGLRHLPLGLLYIARAGLIVIFAIHIVGAISLQSQNAGARPTPYHMKKPVVSSMASRTMLYTGLLIITFVLYHLAHFTWHLFGEVPHLSDGAVDVYGMVVMGFKNPVIALSYIAAMIVLGLHLSHGIASFFQTAGFNHNQYNGAINCAGKSLAWAIALANISIPVSVWLGFISLT